MDYSIHIIYKHVEKMQYTLKHIHGNSISIRVQQDVHIIII